MRLPGELSYRAFVAAIVIVLVADLIAYRAGASLFGSKGPAAATITDLKAEVARVSGHASIVEGRLAATDERLKRLEDDLVAVRRAVEAVRSDLLELRARFETCKGECAK